MKNLLLILFIFTQSLFGLVTIAPVEIGQKPGLSNTLEAALETTRGNSDTDNYKASFRTTYDNAYDHVAWAEISGAYGKANGQENTNKLFSHVRYIHALTEEIVRGEIFAQVQKDEFKRINSRVLGGGGVRFKIFDLLQNSKGYLGIGAFYENIRYKSSLLDPSENNLRVNSYFAYTIDLNENSSVAYTLYYQPKADDFNDNIQSHDIELKLNIYKDLFLKFTVSYDRDTKPPMGIKKYDLTQNTSFIYNF